VADSDLVPHVPFDIEAIDGRISISVSPAAAAHLNAWDSDKKLCSAHEAGHVVLATVLRIRVKEVDVTGRRGGMTMFGEGDDDLSEWMTASRQFDRIVVSLGGLAAERLLLGELTTGSAVDIADATSLALSRFDSGLDPDAPVFSVSSFMGEEPESLREIRASTAIAVVARARSRAEELAAEHRDEIVAFARLLYAARRLTDEALLAAIREAGLDPVPLNQ
jgi:cell division protease FtsH